MVTSPDGGAALASIAQRRPDVVVTDLKMPGMSGLELVEQVRTIDDGLPVVLMTAYGAVDTAVKAMKLGAFDYLTKPFEGDELVIAVKRAIEHARLLRENAVLRSAAMPAAGDAAGAARTGLDRLVGDSPAIRRVKQQVLAVAESHGTVLVCGESGTGKEVVAKAIHELSPRCQEPFLAVNCAALSESLLESELFGHERGAFTGAERLRKGRFELSNRGTLLLDEISEISASVQAKLLRVLQERAFERVGSSMSIGVDVRVIATSNRDLPSTVSRGQFRQDLFFRLNVLPIHLPPLRDRLEDVPALAEWFLGQVSVREGRPLKRFSDEALSLMMEYPWLGNVRELSNICERAAVLCRMEVIDRDLIEPWLMGVQREETLVGVGAGEFSMGAMGGVGGMGGVHGEFANGVHGEALRVHVNGEAVARFAEEAVVRVEGRMLEDIEREAIVKTLTKFGGHRQRTASALGIGVRTLGLKLKRWKEMQLVDSTL